MGTTAIKQTFNEITKIISIEIEIDLDKYVAPSVWQNFNDFIMIQNRNRMNKQSPAKKKQQNHPRKKNKTKQKECFLRISFCHGMI